MKVSCLQLLKKSLKQELVLLTGNTNGKGSPEYVAETMLLENKLVSEATKKMKDELNLDDNMNPGWKDDLDVIFNEMDIEKRESLTKMKKRDVKKIKTPVVEEVSGGEWQREDQNEKKTDEKLLKAHKDRKPQNLAVDSFFVTKTGGNYLSTVVINRTQPKPPNDGMVRKERRQQAFRNSGHPLQVKSRYPKPWEVPNTNNYSSPNSGMINNRPKVYTQNLKTDNRPKFDQRLLHPSWEAKKNMRQSLPKFEGQKITFNDDE